MSEAQFDGKQLYALCERLYPIARSLTGPGVRATLQELARTLVELAPDAPALETVEIASGETVFDWTVPDEWVAREAWIRGPDGRKRARFSDHSLHLLGYSEPVHTTMPLAQLQSHLFSMPDRPDWIPYRTSYYRRTWGFCLTDRERASLPDGDYEVYVDADLGPGSLTYGELVLPGESDREILVWTHVCHPSLANDNLSGMSVALAVAAAWARRNRRHTLRFVFAPGTIGAIAWLARHPQLRARIAHALVMSNLGDAGPFHYKQSRDGTADVDRVFAHLFANESSLGEATILPFEPYGYDERQFNSPGIGIAAGCLTRTPHGLYPQYHTSGDDLSFISGTALVQACALVMQATRMLDGDRSYRNLEPYGEPQLGKRGLYDTTGGENERRLRQLATLWVLNQSDGSRSLIDIAIRARMPFAMIEEAANALLAGGLLADITPSDARSGSPDKGSR
ncbi:MAG: DUF4910 domain-containing protein [Burkholderiaceae bacterium]